MNKRIEDAINLRISLIKYIRAAKKIDSTICGFDFLRYNPGVQQICEFAIWEDWRKLASDFQSTMNCTAYCEIPTLVIQAQEKFEYLFKRTILEALVEILLCQVSCTELFVFKGGISLDSTVGFIDQNYRSRYYIPKDILDIIGYSDPPVLTEQLVTRAFDAFISESIGNSEYFSYGGSTIYIQVAQS